MDVLEKFTATNNSKSLSTFLNEILRATFQKIRAEYFCKDRFKDLQIYLINFIWSVSLECFISYSKLSYYASYWNPELPASCQTPSPYSMVATQNVASKGKGKAIYFTNLIKWQSDSEKLEESSL